MSSSTAEVSIEQENKALVSEFMEVFSRGDVEAILSFLAPTATWWVGGTIEGISGTKNKEEFGAMLSGLSATTKTGAIALKPLAFTAEGERVA
ncbi:nuclear transport factor 2 family protein, partial [Gordonia paraffinivorans]